MVIPSPADSRCGLGLDAGGTATRWLLLDEAGRERGRGEAAGFAANQLGSGQQPWRDALAGTQVAPAQPDGALAAAHLALGQPVPWQNF